jgi:uncharacterized protein
MTIEQEEIIRRVAVEVKEKLEPEGSGHDWWHAMRVWNMAQRIAEREGADIFVVELAAVLHDIADWKDFDGDVTIGPAVAREILLRHGTPADATDHVCDIIEHLSFKGAGVKDEMKTIEGKIVQDADRLDGIGAIGIARTFVYSGNKSRIIHDPNEALSPNATKEEYLTKGGRTAINHFYEKILLLKDRMNTNTAKEIAKHRHSYIEGFLKEFFEEWEGLR